MAPVAGTEQRRISRCRERLPIDPPLRQAVALERTPGTILRRIKETAVFDGPRRVQDTRSGPLKFVLGLVPKASERYAGS